MAQMLLLHLFTRIFLWSVFEASREYIRTWFDVRTIFLAIDHLADDDSVGEIVRFVDEYDGGDRLLLLIDRFAFHCTVYIILNIIIVTNASYGCFGIESGIFGAGVVWVGVMSSFRK